MTDEPKTKTDPARTPDSREKGPGTASGGGRTSRAPSNPPQGDPPRRAFGDRVADASKTAAPAKDRYPLPGAQTDEDGGEYDKGPRAEAAPAKGAPEGRSTPPQQQNKSSPQAFKAQPAMTNDKSGNACKTPGKDPAGKSAGKSGGGCATP